MADWVGKQLEVGDSVVYIKKTYYTSCLARGTVSSIKKMFGKDIAVVSSIKKIFGKDIAVVNGYKVTSQSIYKLEK